MQRPALRNRLKTMDYEQIGRAFIEYAGVPLAVFMAAGMIVEFFKGYGMHHAFVDPAQNYLLYFVLNFWIVVGVYTYRQRYQQPLLFEGKHELALAGIAALTWIATQPILLLVGYAFFMKAVMQKDELHSSFLPDLNPEVDEDGVVEDETPIPGRLERLRQHLPF